MTFNMLDPQFGKLVPTDFPDERDAIHIACVAVFAETDLEPGAHVGLTTEAADVMGLSDIAPLGIVDPFLRSTVKKGERFWVFLYPGTIASLRHNWSHPSFDIRNRAETLQKLRVELTETPAKRRMKAFAETIEYGGEDVWNAEHGRYDWIVPPSKATYEELIDRATAYVTGGEYWSEGGSFEGQGIYGEFWDDFEELTGLKVPEGDRYSFFSCSC